MVLYLRYTRHKNMTKYYDPPDYETEIEYC